MSRYAKINSQNIVENVIICEDANISMFDGAWIKITEDTNFAETGSVYVPEKQKFIEIKPPFESWTLNENTLKWESPAGTKPAHNYSWDEDSLSWIESEEAPIE